MKLYEVLNKTYGFNFKSNKTIPWNFFFENVVNFDVKIAKKYHKYFKFDLFFCIYKLSEREIEELIDYANWDIISEGQQLSENFIEKYSDNLNWNSISLYQTLSEGFIEKHADKINWSYISDSQTLSESFIEKYKNRLDLEKIVYSQILSQSFIEKNLSSAVSLDQIVGCQSVSEEYLEKNIEFFTDSTFRTISYKQCLSEKFINKYADKLDWVSICLKQKLSEELIEKHLDKIDWSEVCTYQKLSEDFIRRHKDNVIWFSLSFFQKFSEKFIDEFKNELYWDEICRKQKLSDKFINSHKNYVYQSSTDDNWSDKLMNKLKTIVNKDARNVLIDDNWIYKSTEDKKQAVIDTGKYECHVDYFIAYKAIRPDRYSLFNFQYKYKKGCIYESWCDCSNYEDSFGLNVGTEFFAKSYGNKRSIIVRCKVNYKDIGRVVHYGDKIRCFKIEILD